MPNIIEDALGISEGQLEFLNYYSGAELKQLQTMFEKSRELQKAQTEEAIESGLQIVPALLRKTVRKAFGGK